MGMKTHAPTILGVPSLVFFVSMSYLLLKRVFIFFHSRGRGKNTVISKIKKGIYLLQLFRSQLVIKCKIISITLPLVIFQYQRVTFKQQHCCGNGNWVI